MTERSTAELNVGNNASRIIDLAEINGDFSPVERVSPVSIRCPHCGRVGAFQAVTSCGRNATIASFSYQFELCVRFCPAPECHGTVFTITVGKQLLFALPRPRLEFDASNVPARIADSLGEAVVCHAHGCFKAAALMVRRSLEELCEDRGATGKNLAARIADLGSKITIPKELLEALDELRILGNDAAHIDAREYDQVGELEVEAALALAQEIVKATYQYSDLLGRLRSLRKSRE